MARRNISLPDDLDQQARTAHLNESALAQRAVAEELERQSKQAALDAYLAELHDALGPISDEEQHAAREWADRGLAPTVA